MLLPALSQALHCCRRASLAFVAWRGALCPAELPPATAVPAHNCPPPPTPPPLPALQPTISEDAELGPEGDKGKRRTLAGKLLGRGRSKSGKAGGDASSSTGSLDRLAFGSHQLTQQGHRRCGGGDGGWRWEGMQSWCS